MRQTILLALAGVAMLGGCATAPVSPGGNATVERWEWVSSVGGFAGRTTTPAEQGFRVRYAFGGDGTLVVTRTPGGETRTRFTTTEESGADGTTRTVVRYADEVNVLAPPLREQFLRRVGRDTLVLSDPCADCFEHTFVRVP